MWPSWPSLALYRLRFQYGGEVTTRCTDSSGMNGIVRASAWMRRCSVFFTACVGCIVGYLFCTVRGGMRHKRACKDIKGQVFGRLRKPSVQTAVACRQEKRCGVVMPLPDKLAAEQLVAPCIGSVDKFRQDLEVWLCDPHRQPRPCAVLKQKDIAKPWPYRRVKRPFTVCRPQVESTPHRLFGAVVEVIPE